MVVVEPVVSVVHTPGLLYTPPPSSGVASTSTLIRASIKPFSNLASELLNAWSTIAVIGASPGNVSIDSTDASPTLLNEDVIESTSTESSLSIVVMVGAV